MLLFTLGGLELEGAEFNRPKPLLLLCYLALQGPQERAYLAKLFFPDSTKARASLSTTLSRLRQAVPGVVEADGQHVSTSIETDVAQLLTLIDEGEFEQAVALYSGRFLSGVNTSDVGVELEEWIYHQRELIAARVRQALLALAEQVAAQGQYAEAAAYAERAYLLSGAPEPEAVDYQRIYALLVAASHPQAAEVKSEAESYGVSLALVAEEAQLQFQGAEALHVQPQNPYKGLSFYREEDAALFYGREAVLAELLTELERQPVLSIVGSSGSGKSSLVFAGLVPALRERNWLITSFRPGLSPFLALATSLLDFLEPELSSVDKLREAKKLASAFESAELSLSDLLLRIKQDYPEQQLLLIIDQFEELYTFSEGKQAYPKNFLDQLLAALEKQHAFCKLVLTLRSDFLTTALTYRPMVDLLQSSEYLLGPLDNEELRSVIVEPAKQCGVSFEDGLVERILQDVLDREGNLPLLAFSLSELWEQQAHSTLTHTAYDALGGVELALSRHADALYAKLSEVEQQAAERVFLQLVYPGAGQEDTRRVATFSELGEHWDLITKLASAPARLLVTGRGESGEQTVEVIHEALIRHWAALRGWMNAHRSFRSWQEHLRQDVRRWLSQHDEGYLLRGFPLEEAKQQLAEHQDKLSPDEQAFIQASVDLQAKEQAEIERRQRERSALRRRFTQFLAVALVVALMFAGIAGWQWQQAKQRSQELADREQDLELALSDAQAQRTAVEEQKALVEEQRDEAQRQRGIAEEQRRIAEQQRKLITLRFLEGQAQVALEKNDYSLASLLLAQSLSMTKDDPALLRFASILLRFPEQLLATLSAGPFLEEITFSPDGTHLLSSRGDVWDLSTYYHRTLTSWPGEGMSVAFHPDGSRFATGHRDEHVRFWRKIGNLEMFDYLATGEWSKAERVRYSPDGQYVAIADSHVTLWDVTRREGINLGSASDEHQIQDVAFSPDSRLLASAELELGIALWDVASQTRLRLLDDVQPSVQSVAFSPDGSLLAAGNTQGEIILWDASTFQVVGELDQHLGAVLDVVFSPDGALLASAGEDQTINLWDVESLTTWGEGLTAHADSVRSLAFSPDGQTLASSDATGRVLLWRLVEHSHRTVVAPRRVAKLAVSPDGQSFASLALGGDVLVWDVDKPEQWRVVNMQEPFYASALSFNADGSVLIMNNPGRSILRLWDADSLEELDAVAIPDLNSTIQQVAVSPDGAFYALGDSSGNITLWNVARHAVEAGPVEAHSRGVNSLGFNADSSVLASTSRDGTILVWDVRSLQSTAQITFPANITTLALSPDGATLAVGSIDRSVLLWDVSTQTLMDRIQANQGPVRGLAFHPDGSILVHAYETSIHFWDVAAQLPWSFPYRLEQDAQLRDVAFTPDGRHLISAGRDVNYWQAKPEAMNWQERTCLVAGRNFTEGEWRNNMGDLPYERVCPQFPG